jgi:hypothetical protein
MRNPGRPLVVPQRETSRKRYDSMITIYCAYERGQGKSTKVLDRPDVNGAKVTTRWLR